MSSNNSSMKLNNKSNKFLVNVVLISIVVLLILFFIYSLVTSYYSYKKNSPYLIDGITDATMARKFDGYLIEPPTNNAYGTEFTYSCWLFIKDTNFSSTQTCSGGNTPLKHIFHKGSYDFIPTGGSTNGNINYPLLQMPGVWLYPNTNKLNIQLNTFENVLENSDVGNIPLNMWVNLIIVLIGNSVDIYINGNLKKRTKLSGVPKINYGNLYATNWGGFDGYTSRLRYFNYAIQPFLIDQIFNLGPGSQFDSNSSSRSSITDPTAQLSKNYWMTTGYPNSVNYPGYKQQ